MLLFIKYLVSSESKFFVKTNLEALGLRCIAINIGEVEIIGRISIEQRNIFRIALIKAGLELIEDKKAILIEKLKKTIIYMVHSMEGVPKSKNSDYITKQLNRNYNYLSNIFSETMGSTIEQYVIIQKIERVKELLLFDELSLTQISYKLNYCNVAHLSTQFKKFTGCTPSLYKLSVDQQLFANNEQVEI